MKVEETRPQLWDGKMTNPDSQYYRAFEADEKFEALENQLEDCKNFATLENFNEEMKLRGKIEALKKQLEECQGGLEESKISRGGLILEQKHLKTKAEALEKQLEELKDVNGEVMKVGGIYTNGKLSAPLCFGKYKHHFPPHSSSWAFGYYFDGDEGFYLSDHISVGENCLVWKLLTNKEDNAK